MKKFVIDFDAWICGSDDRICGNFTGEGKTRMLNHQGYMCCLGQIYKSLGVEDEKMLDQGEPFEVEVNTFLVEFDEYELINSDLACKAMWINDDNSTRVADKINDLRELFSENGYELEFINVPEWVAG